MQGQGWVEAGSLGIGTSIVTRAGPALQVTDLTWQKNKAQELASGGGLGGYTVYNLTVEDDHTFFVGTTGGGTWVHNACRAYQVGTHGDLDAVSDPRDGFQLHHAPQWHLAQSLGIPGYTYSNAPAIALPDAEHYAVNTAQRLNRAARNDMNASQLFNDDINIITQHTNAPPSAIQALRNLGAQFGL